MKINISCKINNYDEIITVHNPKTKQGFLNIITRKVRECRKKKSILDQKTHYHQIYDKETYTIFININPYPKSPIIYSDIFTYVFGIKRNETVKIAYNCTEELIRKDIVPDYLEVLQWLDKSLITKLKFGYLKEFVSKLD